MVTVSYPGYPFEQQLGQCAIYTAQYILWSKKHLRASSVLFTLFVRRA
jgi:hypothetical protein